MKKERLITLRPRRKNLDGEKGYTLLEYCAGAALIAGVLWGALSYLGNNLDGLLRNVGDWANSRATSVQTS